MHWSVLLNQPESLLTTRNMQQSKKLPRQKKILSKNQRALLENLKKPWMMTLIQQTHWQQFLNWLNLQIQM